MGAELHVRPLLAVAEGRVIGASQAAERVDVELPQFACVAEGCPGRVGRPRAEVHLAGRQALNLRVSGSSTESHGCSMS